MTKNKSPLARLIDWVWREPKGRVGAKLKQICDDMPHKQRLMVVTVLLSAFVLIAFFVFGHACYKIGAKRALFEYEVEHLYNLDLPEHSVKDTVCSLEKFYIPTDSAYDDTGVESED
ncbi:DUF3989 domain-containing protein [Muribaculaceae bacterium Isolate-039 (Harlan)]|jgi:hypothetical protein|uniref:DUF3989 domain-containing protein n=3 Tax=Muribaculaceae TaxID=2005473 RepID=A0A2V1IPZ8_9BACT|nr:MULTISPECIES: TraL conjugative transposon family protein [Bacteroidales]ROS86216.1 DUF3989 domain-containing protein [Muribaculaceae bacterium Isolate-039 (Harlan)]ROS89489.1 DUF3989 domain-containing protein [Muribaculaceae bacterium Isolate-043 (Harlan)]MYM13580.1 DUF3989 domain-containing protein [Muribaculum intestinale]PWB06571.1 DUF3989 domain-containing protein [Paramuribaculum intestinale]PWB10897.1 DUF3989 domain-containing protein [Paramuribaculum intestinale]